MFFYQQFSTVLLSNWFHFWSNEWIIFESSNIIASIESFRIFEYHCFHSQEQILVTNVINYQQFSTVLLSNRFHFRSIESFRIFKHHCFHSREQILVTNVINYQEFSMFSYLIDPFSIDRTNHFQIFEHHCFHSRKQISFTNVFLSTIFHCSHIWSIHFRSIERIFISNLNTLWYFINRKRSVVNIFVGNFWSKKG